MIYRKRVSHKSRKTPMRGREGSSSLGREEARSLTTGPRHGYGRGVLSLVARAGGEPDYPGGPKAPLSPIAFLRFISLSFLSSVTWSVLRPSSATAAGTQYPL